MIQTGDPTNTGKGGESIYGGFFNDEFVDSITHDKRGIVSMANKGPDTNGSQFFITYKSLPYLNKKFTVFGKVIAGMETLDAFEKVATDGGDVPLQEIGINYITIHANHPMPTNHTVLPSVLSHFGHRLVKHKINYN